MKPKLFILLTLLLGLSACIPTPTPTAKLTQPTATATATPEPENAPLAESESIAATPTTTLTPELTESEEDTKCTYLLTPIDEAEFPATGAVNFSWEPVDDATLYQLYITFPTEVDLTFELEESSITRYLEAFSMHPAYHQGGEHQWNVTALNAAGEEICSSDFFTFTKPQASGNAPQGDAGDGQLPEDPFGTPKPEG